MKEIIDTTVQTDFGISLPAQIIVVYDSQRGFAGNREEPAEPAGAAIQYVTLKVQDKLIPVLDYDEQELQAVLDEV